MAALVAILLVRLNNCVDLSRVSVALTYTCTFWFKESVKLVPSVCCTYKRIYIFLQRTVI